MDFVSALMEMQSGEVAATANQKLQELTAAVMNTGRKGALNLKISVEPSKRAMGGAVLMVTVSAAVTLIKPELPLGSTPFFVDDEANLTQDDPRRDDRQAGLFTISKEDLNAQ